MSRATVCLSRRDVDWFRVVIIEQLDRMPRGSYGRACLEALFVLLNRADVDIYTTRAQADAWIAFKRAVGEIE